MNKISVFHIEVIYFPVMMSCIEKNYPGTLFTLIVLLSCSICAEEANPEMVFRIDYHSGKVSREVSKPGRHWQEIESGSFIKNHDKIKTWNQAEGAELSDTNTRVTLRNDTRVYINSPENLKAKHLTLYKGGIFFFPKERYLKNRRDKFEYTISTEHAHIKPLKAPGFFVETFSDSTIVGIIGGSILVKDIIHEKKHYGSAGYTITIKPGDEPDYNNRAALDISGIDWVSDSLIKSAEKRNTSLTRSDYSKMTGELIGNAAVIPFTNISDYTGKWEIEDSISSFITEETQTHFSITECLYFPNKEGYSPVEAGKRLNARFIVTGEIERFSFRKRQSVSADLDAYRESYIFEVFLTASIYDAETGKLLARKEFKGDKSTGISGSLSFKELESLPFSLKNSDFLSSLPGKAIKRVIIDLSDFIASVISDNTAQGNHR